MSDKSFGEKLDVYKELGLLIEQGIKIAKQNIKEDDELVFQGILSPGEIDGPEYRAWLDKVNLFNEKYLKRHPQYKEIRYCYSLRKAREDTFEEIMGHLKTVFNDKRFFGDVEQASVRIKMSEEEVNDMKKSRIFISHRSFDKEVADIIQDFLIAIGVPRSMIFCSSLPGNDVKEKISSEIKEALKNSCLNIVILSRDYYNSPYCLNEAGILWFLDIPVIPIAMPEICYDNMEGFLGNEYKLRELANEIDIAYINDTLCEIGIIKSTQGTVLSQETKKVISRYNHFIENRKNVTDSFEEDETTYRPNTDDESVVLYYIVSNKVRRIRKVDLENWLYESEIYGINIENAFDLISASGLGIIDNDTLILEIDTFRRIVSDNDNELQRYKRIVDEHIIRADSSFLDYWNTEKIDVCTLLFILYIIDKRVFSFGDRWKADIQIKDIEQWESDNCIAKLVSKNYQTCLAFFIDNKWVYPCEYTKDGNPREYRICNSLKQLLIDDYSTIRPKLVELRKQYDYSEDLAF